MQYINLILIIIEETAPNSEVPTGREMSKGRAGTKK